MRPSEKGGNYQAEQREPLKVSVREFRFVGNTVFSGAALTKVLADFVGKELDSDQLEDARRALTRHYVDHGFINSGAILEDQPVKDGVLTFRIVEGRLSGIEIKGNERLRTNFIRSRIERGAGDPLNLRKLQDALLLLKDNPNLGAINAKLMPGTVRGESRLELKVKEKNPWRLGLQARNDRPASVGAEVIELLASHQNVTGNSDALDFQYGLLQRSRSGLEWSALDNLGAGYRIPLNARETTMQLAYQRSDYAVIDAPFDTLDIMSRSDSYRVGVRQPFWRTPTREFSMTIAADRRHSESFLLGERFSFSPGAVDGETTVTALRLIHEWVERSQAQVMALRSTLSWGMDALGSTDDGTERDGKFVTWLGQGQYVRRLGETDNQLILRSTFQWSKDPLLSLEQLSLGGAHTVRGYRENQLVRDLGVLTSLEFRIPVLFGKAGGPMVQLAPFVDYGNGWNLSSPKGDPRDLGSAGLGLIFTLFTPHKKIHGELYWGYAFRDFHQARDDDLQDQGVHFRVVVSAF